MNKNLLLYFAMAISTGFVLILVILIFIAVPEGNKAVLYTLVGAYATGVVTIWGFYWGSSQSSADKTQIIDKMQGEKKSDAPPQP